MGNDSVSYIKKYFFLFYTGKNGCPLISLKPGVGNFLAVQWLGLGIFTAEGTGSVPGWGTNIPQAARCGQTNKQKNPKPQRY